LQKENEALKTRINELQSELKNTATQLSDSKKAQEELSKVVELLKGTIEKVRTLLSPTDSSP
jgi:predicted  nucleic acid-binding Zn-ribbon protein